MLLPPPSLPSPSPSDKGLCKEGHITPGILLKSDDAFYYGPRTASAGTARRRENASLAAAASFQFSRKNLFIFSTKGRSSKRPFFSSLFQVPNSRAPARLPSEQRVSLRRKIPKRQPAPRTSPGVASVTKRKKEDRQL